MTKEPQSAQMRPYRRICVVLGLVLTLCLAATAFNARDRAHSRHSNNNNNAATTRTVGDDPQAPSYTKTQKSFSFGDRGGKTEQQDNPSSNTRGKRKFGFGGRGGGGPARNKDDRDAPTKRTFFVPSQNVASEIQQDTEEQQDVIKVTAPNGKQFHAVRSGESVSGAVIHRGGGVPVGFAGQDEDEEEATDRHGDDQEGGFKGVGFGRGSSSNTRGVRRKPGKRGFTSSFSRNHRDTDNNDDGNHNRKKQRRGLKQQARIGGGGGIGKLKGGRGGFKDRSLNPLECNARKGKKCKKTDLEVRAGERRGGRLTKEGDVEKLIRPDFTLEDIYNGQAFDVNPDLAKFRATQATYYGEKRFFSMPQAGSTSTSTQTIEVQNEQDKGADKENKPKKAMELDDHKGETVPQFVPRAIPNRYGRIHNQHSSYGGGNGGGNANAGNSGTDEGKEEQDNYGTIPRDEAWVTSYYRARNSFYAEEGVHDEGEEKEEATDQVGSAVAHGAEEGEDGDALARDNIPPPPETAYDHYAAWFNEMEDGSGGLAGSSTSMFSTQSDGDSTFFEDDEEDQDESYYGVSGYLEEGYGEQGAAADFFDNEEQDEYDEEEVVEEEDRLDGDEVDGEAGLEGQDNPAEDEPYLSNFASTLTPNANSKNSYYGGNSGWVSHRDNYPGEDGMEQTKNYADSETSTATETDTTESAQQSITLTAEEDETGVMYFTETITADPVYVETRGSTDLSKKKQEVFDNLTPLLSRHLEEYFGDELIEDYQLTITYIQSEDAVLQLRRGSDAKTYVTELVVLVVLHLRSPDKGLVMSVTPEVATDCIDSFFDPAGADLKTFLRVLNAEGLYTKEIYAQDKPRPPRNHAMEHGISKITPSDSTADANATGAQATDDESDEVVWSFNSFFGDTGTRVAVIASLITAIFVFMAVLGALWLKKEHQDKLRRHGRAVLHAAGDVGNDLGSRAQVSLQHAKFKLQRAKDRARDKIRRSRRSGYFNLNFMRGRGRSAASVVSHSDASSTLSYIQPAAIQLRRGRNRTISVPVDESPLEGRQDDDDMYEDPSKPSSIYDIDINDDNDLFGTRKELRGPERVSLPDKHDYESDGDSSSDDSSSDGDDTTSQLSRLSLDRISIARSSKAVDDKNSVEERRRHTPLQTFKDDEDEEESDSDVEVDVDDEGGNASDVLDHLLNGDASDNEDSVRGGAFVSSDEESSKGRFVVDTSSQFVNNSLLGHMTADEESAQSSMFDNESSVDTGSQLMDNRRKGSSLNTNDPYASAKGISNIGSYATAYGSTRTGGTGSRKAADFGVPSFETEPLSQVPSSLYSEHATKRRHSLNLSSEDDDSAEDTALQRPDVPASPKMRGNRRHARPNERLTNEQSFMPLSPLSAVLAEALAETPSNKALTHTDSRPRTPIPARRRAPDPPESRASAFSTGQYPRYGYRMSPPTSMRDILPDEYLNKKRWQDEEDDTTVDLPDHLSSAATSQFSFSTSGAASANTKTSAGSEMDMTTETGLVGRDSEHGRGTPYAKQLF